MPEEEKQLQRVSDNEKNKAIRISTAEREQVITRLQNAFAEGRLDDRELDERVLQVLNAKTAGDLEPVVNDLPAEPVQPLPRHTGHSGRTGRFILGYGSRIERKGRWKVPPKANPVIFKGHMVLDLRTAELSDPETRFNVLAYKGTLEIIVLPGVQVEAHGLTYKGGWINALEGERAAPGAPVIHIHGLAYKSKVVIRHAGTNVPDSQPDQK